MVPLLVLGGSQHPPIPGLRTELIPKIGKKLLQAGPVLGPTVDLATGGVGGTLIEKSLDFTRRYFSDGESVEGLFWRLSDALARQDKRYLVIIDDIDRLAPDEALLVFRLVKSVGRLPNVMYLLLFDRTLAEMTVQERYPSEGPHFLEKIIQATFELPLPAHDDLYNSVLAEIEERCGAPQEAEIRRFMNLFYDAVALYIRKPRDVVRLTNAISVTWPSVEGEVNLADFVSLETLRVFEPNLYNAIRTNKPRICGIRSEYDREDQDKTIEKLLENVSLSHRESATNALKRLFPRLENVGYGPDFADSWNAQRLVCSKNHFDTYFRLSVGDETLPAKEIDTLIENCGDPDYVKNAFRKALDIVRKSGKSKVPLLLDELNVHASRIERQKFEPLISGLFAVADDINRESDKERGFSIGDNHLRIHWLIRKLTFERCDLHERSKIFVNACKQAQVGWLVDFTTSAIGDYYPREGQEPEPPEKCLVEKDQVSVLRTIATEKINEAAANGSLIKHPQLAYILYRWRDKFCDGDDIVKAWTKLQLSDDVAVALFARAFTGESWSQGMGMFGPGDHVAVRHTKAAVKSLELLMDVDQFRRRLDELEKAKTLPKPYQAYVEVLLEAWRRRDRGEDRDW